MSGFTVAGLAAVIRRRAWLLVAAAAVAALAANLTAGGQPRSYEAKAVLLVGPINAGLDTLRASGPLAETYAELAGSRPVLASTERRLQMRDLAAVLHVESNQATRLLTIAARDSDPVRAARIANAHADSLVALASQSATGSVPSGRLQVVDPAVPDSSSVGLNPTTLTVLAGIVGLLAALLLFVLTDRPAATIRDGDELEMLTGVPCLAIVGRTPLRRRRSRGPVIAPAPDSRAADQYRMLAAKLDAVGGSSVAVLSVDGADGGVVAANLARALTARGTRIALVDLDVELPERTDARDRSSGDDRDLFAGDELSVPGERDAGDSVAHTGVVLRRPAASSVEDALRGGIEGARALLRELLEDADVVVLHPAGGANSPTGLIWARVAEATLLAVQRERTPRRDVATAVQSLRLVQARIAGTVLTSASRWQ